ncbi:MAG: ABC transporter substrate-binding protein [Leptolyngbyaceae cyanobacterium bins.59]|nr:ABC transporter substrate-binding protein [Leptolyngbyaceae cyanobacterium bins.59]
MRWVQRSLLMMAALLLVLVSCSRQPVQETPPPTQAPQGRIILGTTARIRTLDPADAYEIFPGLILGNLGDRLYTYNVAGTEIQPQLATTLPDISSDGRTYTIPLRQGVVFHDGTPFNAEAMAFSLRRFVQNAGQPSFLLADKVQSIEATGEFELTIRLKQPFAALTSLLTFSGTCAVSPKAYTIGPGQFKPDAFVGTGPYRLARYGPDSLQLEVFDRYWGEKPVNQGVNIQLFSSPANLFNAFRTAAVDVAYQNLEPEQVQSLQQGAAAGGWQVIEGQGSAVYYLALNLRQKPVDNDRVRQAIAAMVNRTLIRDRVFQGQAEPLYSLIPRNFAVSQPVFQEKYGDGNATLAKQLLTQAGFSPSQPLVLPLWYPANSAVRTLMASVLKATAEETLGGMMRLELNGVDSATANQNLDRGVYPAFLLSWYPDFYDPDTYLQPFLECSQGSEAKGCDRGGSQSQGSFYYNPKANQWVSQQRQTANPQTRKEAIGALQQLLVEDVPYVPLVQTKEYAFAQKGIQGVNISPTQKFSLSRIAKM